MLFIIDRYLVSRLVCFTGPPSGLAVCFRVSAAALRCATAIPEPRHGLGRYCQERDSGDCLGEFIALDECTSDLYVCGLGMIRHDCFLD